MPSFREAFSSTSKYLKAANVTRRRVVEVERVGYEDVGPAGQPTQSKLVARFVRADQGLVLNVTNAEAVAKIAGTDDYLEWPGTEIELYPTETELKGRRVPCIRVAKPKTRARGGKPVEAEPSQATEPPEWVGEGDQTEEEFL